jgi:hypothetical protein
VAYYQFLKGGAGGDGPSKEELKLRCAQRRAQRTGDPAVLQKVLLDFEGVDEFCTRSPHLVLLRETQGLMLHPSLPSSRSRLHLCSRFPHPLPLVWIFAVLLLSENLK